MSELAAFIIMKYCFTASKREKKGLIKDYIEVKVCYCIDEKKWNTPKN
jgi:hypothetical protein